MPQTLKPPAADPATVPVRTGSSLPEQFRQAIASRRKRRIGDAVGITQYGVNLVDLGPGDMSSQRHWHEVEDEFVYVLEGELTLITDEGEQVLASGHCAGFPAGKSSGHHMINRSAKPARYLEIGTRVKDDVVHYSDIDLDLKVVNDAEHWTDKKGKPYR
ncbi:MAG TPA: cupin domain-containing protein [Alphaproteobacteria bacterium]|nr:cupin domain-containing protein [Alphaproteobacteria bacterium]